PGVEIVRRLIQELRDKSFTLQQDHGTTVAAGSAASSQVTSEQPVGIRHVYRTRKGIRSLEHLLDRKKKGMAEINSLVIVQRNLLDHDLYLLPGIQILDAPIKFSKFQNLKIKGLHLTRSHPKEKDHK
ncbi:hypothetical protein HID58_045120, partial [Brassica napus]